MEEVLINAMTMRIALISENFPPLRNSGAVQLRDLSKEFLNQGHEVIVMTPSSEINQPWLIEECDGIIVLRLKAPRTKDINYIRRTIGEFLMPYFMLWNYRKSPFRNYKWEGVVWYSPSIFHGYFAKSLKNHSSCRGYLIVRDIFPEWAVDMGLMSRGMPYRFFKKIANYQYSVADIIGVQTQGNLTYFKSWQESHGKQLEVLQNWLMDISTSDCSINIAATHLSGRKIFVYAGNMGVAQGMNALIELVVRMRDRNDVGFVFVGRGSELSRLKEISLENDLGNVLFYDEIHPDEIPGLYKQCHIGLVALDPRHKSHNIPGKFLTYMQSGLPVLAQINAGNDLAGLIRREELGRVNEDGTTATLESLAAELITVMEVDDQFSTRCRDYYLKTFSPKVAVNQITSALKSAIN